MTEAEVREMLAKGGGRVKLGGTHSASLRGRTGQLIGPFDGENFCAHVLVDGDTTVTPCYIASFDLIPEPVPSPWQPGDTAVTGKYTRGRVSVRLVRRDEAMPTKWLVTPGDDARHAYLFEDEFSRPRTVDFLMNPDWPLPRIADLEPPVMTPEEERKAMAELSRKVVEAILIPKPAQKHGWKAGDRVVSPSGVTCYLVAPVSGSKGEWWHASHDANLMVLDRVINVTLATPAPKPKPTIREPSIECEKDWNRDLKQAVTIALATPSKYEIRAALRDHFQAAGVAPEIFLAELDRFEADRTKIIAELKAEGLPAVVKHLDGLLESYGIKPEERASIIAQVEKGDRATRDTASLYATMRGVLEWQQEKPQDRRVWWQVTGHVLLAHATTIPGLDTVRVKFRASLSAAEAHQITDGVVRSGIDATVDRQDGEVVVLPFLAD